MTTEPEINKLREEIITALFQDIERQTDGRWPADENEDETIALVDAYLDFGELADRILAIPAIADRLSVAPLSSPGDVSA